MNFKSIVLGLTSVVVLASCGAQKQKAALKLETNEAQTSYAIGYNMGQNLKNDAAMFTQQFPQLDTAIIYAAIIDFLSGTKPQLSDSSMQDAVNTFQQNMMADRQKQASTEAVKYEAESQAFMAEELKNDSKYKVTETGLMYKPIKEGKGAKPTVESTVKVFYTGTLIDGTIFDQTKGEPVEFPLAGVIPGWTEGLQLMNEGSTYKLLIPSELAYGTNPPPSSPIKPGMALIFEVELVKIVK